MCIEFTCLVSPLSSLIYPSSVTAYLKDAEVLLRIAAVIAGGVWAYFKFARGRTFASRLEPSIEASAQTKNEQIHVFVTVKVKNVGLSRVILEQRGTGIKIQSVGHIHTETISSVDWKVLGAFSILETHSWIEPGELLCEQYLYIIGDKTTNSVNLHLSITAQKLNWTAMCIALVDPPKAKDLSYE